MATIGFGLFCLFAFIGVCLHVWGNTRYRRPGIETGAKWGLFKIDQSIRPYMRAEDFLTNKAVPYQRWALVLYVLAIVIGGITSYLE